MPTTRSMPPLVLASLLLAAPSGTSADDRPKAGPPAPGNAARELHVVGVYEGCEKTAGEVHGGKARVRVDRPGKRVTLALVSYEPVTWEVEAAPGTAVETVILGGSGRAAVRGLPAGAAVVEAFRGGKNPAVPFHAYAVDAPAYPALAEAVGGITGLPVASFAGAYRADPAAPFAVDAVSADERLSPDYPRPAPAPAAGLPKLAFRAHLFAPGARRHEVEASYGEFTPAGPKADTFRPLPARVTRVAVDPAGNKYYGITAHEVMAVDLDKQTAAKLDPGLDVPRVSWPSDLTFDAKRGRLLVATRAGASGYLYAFTPKAGKWEVLAERPPAVIAYHPGDDAVYGLRGDLGDDRGNRADLVRLNASGAVVGSVRLDGKFAPGALGLRMGSGGLQLAPAGDKLALLVGRAERLGSEAPPPRWSYLYLVDPKTGKADLTWKGQ